MKTSHVLQVVGGMVGMGIVGVITAHLLTQDEETKDAQLSESHGFDRNPFGPVVVHVTLTTEDPNGIVHNNQDTNFTIDAPPANEDVEFFVFAGSPSDFQLFLRRKPKQIKKEPKFKVGGKHPFKARVNFSGVTASEPLVITVSGIGEETGTIYTGELKVILVP